MLGGSLPVRPSSESRPVKTSPGAMGLSPASLRPRLLAPAAAVSRVAIMASCVVNTVAYNPALNSRMVTKNNMLNDFSYNSRLLKKALLGLLLVLLAGCINTGQLTETQRSELDQRVRERWQALEQKDFKKAWEYSSPNYRAIFSKQLYAKKFSYAVEWELTGVEIVNYDSVAAVASVVVRVMSKPTKQTSSASLAIGAIPTTRSERWIFSEGQWWFSANY